MTGFLLYSLPAGRANMECATLWCADLHLAARADPSLVIVYNDGSLPALGHPIDMARVVAGMQLVEQFRRIGYDAKPHDGET